ncbi:MAG: MBL fold metallo-hydrolase [Chlamydiae bacterium]|nr:MBL fold metallo-hydrolase [Chlamydiota bacterium]
MISVVYKKVGGFSALVEYEGSKILFDAGGDAAAFSLNADKMQLSYSEITHLLFSHRHWDHIAGFKEIVGKVGPNAALYVPKTFPWFLLRNGSARLKKTKIVKSFEAIAPNIYSLVLRGGFWLYEQALILKTPEGLGIITGCAHPGIIQVIKAAKQHLQAKISFVLGGFHLLSDRAESRSNIVKQFQDLNVKKVAPCHCTGDHFIRQFYEAYGPNFFKAGTGTVLTF